MGKIPVDAVETALRILEQLERHGPCSVTELASRADVPKATAYYHVETLVHNGYVAETDAGYDLGLRTLELGGQARLSNALTPVVESSIANLASEANELAVFAVREGDSAVVLDLHRPTGVSDHVDVTLGSHRPLYCTATGKALLAGLPDERFEEVLENLELDAHTSETITSASALRDHLSTVRSQGIAYDRGEYDTDVHAVAAPIRGGERTRSGAIGLVGPSSRLYSDRFEHELPHLVERFAERILHDVRS